MASSSSLHRFDLCSIGNVCIDLIDTVDDAFLMRHGLRKSFCVSLTDVQLSELIKDLPSPIRTPGGVGANVAHVVQALGGHACFQGRRGDDNEGKIFADDLARHGIEQHLPQSEGQKSSIVACLSTLDGDRTFGTFDGAGKMLSPVRP